MKVLIVGASGMLGQSVTAEMKESNIDFVAKDSQHLNICDAGQVEEVIALAKPDFVVNCAAYTRVDDAESDEETATDINAIGAQNLANACKKNSTVLVHVSTDYVFDGNGSVPYKETEITMPATVYGKSKLAGERLILESGVDAYILRTAWLYGTGGNNFVTTMIELAAKNPSIKVVDDQFGQPTSTLELAKGVLSLLKNMPEFGIYNATSVGKTTWFSFAKSIFSNLGNHDTELIPVTSSEFLRPAKRPRYSVLSNEKWNSSNLRPFLDWEDALSQYLKENFSARL